MARDLTAGMITEVTAQKLTPILLMKAEFFEADQNNFLQHASAFDQPVWVKDGVGVRSNESNDINGEQNMDSIIERTIGTARDGPHNITQTISGVTINQTWTVSVYVEANGEDSIQILLFDQDSTGNRVGAIYDLSAGSVHSSAAAGNGSVTSTSITNPTGNIYRCVLSGQANTSGSNLSMRIAILDDKAGPTTASDLTYSYTGDGNGVYLWGGQLETGSSVSSVEDNSGDLLLWSGIGNLIYDNEIYTGAGDLLGIDEIEETEETRAVGMTVSITGIPSDFLALALGVNYQQRPLTIWLAALNSSGVLIADPYLLFKGYMDVMEINEGGDTGTISVTVENKLIVLDIPNGRKYTLEDQKIDFPNDVGLEFIPLMQDAEIVLT